MIVLLYRKMFNNKKNSDGFFLIFSSTKNPTQNRFYYMVMQLKIG